MVSKVDKPRMWWKILRGCLQCWEGEKDLEVFPEEVTFQLRCVFREGFIQSTWQVKTVLERQKEGNAWCIWTPNESSRTLKKGREAWEKMKMRAQASSQGALQTKPRRCDFSLGAKGNTSEDFQRWLALWLSGLSFCLRCWHRTRVLLQVPTAPLLNPLPANALGKAETAQALWPLLRTWDTLMEFQALDSTLS